MANSGHLQIGAEGWSLLPEISATSIAHQNLANAAPSLTVEQLRKRREKLLAQLAALNAEAEAIFAPHPHPDSEPDPAHPWGHKKETILGHLRAAGAAGMTVLQLRDATGFDRQSLDRWLFSESAKRVVGLVRIAPAHYRYLPDQTPEPHRDSPKGTLSRNAAAHAKDSDGVVGHPPKRRKRGHKDQRSGAKQHATTH